MESASGMLLILAVTIMPVAAESLPSVAPGPVDKCPVCGMFVAKYPDWVAQVRFTDGHTAFFDGVKDLCKFYFDIGHYRPERATAGVGAVYVTDYYTLEPIAAEAAFFVVGSNVYGPMGHELIAFAAEDQAREFLRDHRGREILRFEAVTPDVVRSLD
jgi:nitrous oxide reductase accessory protein NosL